MIKIYSLQWVLVNYSRVEMIDQIKGVFKLEKEDFQDIYTLLLKPLKMLGMEKTIL